MLAMSTPFPVILAPLELENENLATSPLCKDFGANTYILQKWGAESNLFPNPDQEDFVEENLLSRFSLGPFDPQNIAFADAVLFPSGLDDSVHAEHPW
jgi:hypothetical protein